MSEPFDTVVKQISSYNLFNYLLPGTIFCVLMNKMFGFPFLIENLFAAFFFYYFVGMVISRIGSLTVEPILKKVKFVKFLPYSDFQSASALNQKIEILSEANNTYRTLISLPFCIGVFYAGSKVVQHFEVSPYVYHIGILLGILALFLFSYRKQTQYVVKSIKSTLKKGNE